MSMKPSPGWKGSEAGTPLFTRAQAAVGTPLMSSASFGLGGGAGLMPVTPAKVTDHLCTSGQVSNWWHPPSAPS